MEAGRRSSVTLKPAIAGSNPAPLASAGGVAKRPKAPVPKPEQHQHIRLPNNFIAMGRRDLVTWICGFNTTLRFGGETQGSPHIHRLQLNSAGSKRLAYLRQQKVPHAGGSQSDLAVELSARLIPHPAYTTQYCGGSTTLGYRWFDPTPAPRRRSPLAGELLSGGFTRASPHIRHSQTSSWVETLSVTSPFHGLKTRLRHTHPRNPVEWPVPDGAGHSL